MKITKELNLALRKFKAKINALNFVVNYEEPLFPIGSIESFKAQLKLANEYLEKFPELNHEEFNNVGQPLYVKNSMTSRIKQQEAIEQLEAQSQTNNLPPELVDCHWTERAFRPSALVLIRVKGIKNVIIGRYHHGDNEWFAEMFNGRVDVLEWR